MVTDEISKKYSTQTLLASVQCASVLRDTSDLQQVVKHCVSILFPEHKDYLYAKLQQTSQNIPSASSISRSRLAVDVGMMLLARASNQQVGAKVTRTLLTDSSPQKKFDWCLTEIHSVQTCDLLRIIPLVRRLAGNRPEWHDEENAEETENAHELAQLNAELASLLKPTSSDAPVTFHICPPTAVGSRRSGLIHKIHALLHALFLESGSWAGVQTVLNTCRSIVTDQGVESGMAEARNLRLDQILPWVRS